MSTKTVDLNQVLGTNSANKLKGSKEDDVIFSGGVTSGVERVIGKKGADQFVLQDSDTFVTDEATNRDGFISVRDFTIADVNTNDQADTFNIGGFLGAEGLSATNVGDYLHIVSGLGGDAKTVVYIDKDGGFNGVDPLAASALLDADAANVDVIVEFKGRSANNNFSSITGVDDNTVEQFQALIDLGFLDLSGVVRVSQEVEINQVEGTGDADKLKGSKGDDIIHSGGVSSGTEKIRGKKGSDRLVLDDDDEVLVDQATIKNGFISVRDFTIGDVSTNSKADVFDIGSFLSGVALDASTVGDFLHVVSGRGGDARTVVYLDKEGNFTDAERSLLDGDPRASDVGVDIVVEFKGKAADNNFANITGEIDNSVEQLQALITLGFLDLSKSAGVADVVGTRNQDDLLGTIHSESIFSNGLSSGIESIRGGGGSDRLVLDADDAYVADSANDKNGHLRIRDFVIDDTESNDQADILDVGAFLSQSGLDATNIGNYLHVVSGVYGSHTGGIFIDKEGNFTDQERINLTNNPSEGGQGADLFLEFQGWETNNNFELLTSEADNSVEQFQALIDLGFLDLSSEAQAPDIEEPVPTNWVQVGATGAADSLNGTSDNEAFYSGGVSELVGIVHGDGPYAPGQGRFYYGPGAESISGNGGADKLVLDSDDSFFENAAGNNRGHIRIRDFTIDDTKTNDQADILDIGAFLNGVNLNANNIGNYLHIISGVYGSSNRTGIFIDKDGSFTDEDKAALNANVVEGGHGADLYLEFQGFTDALLNELVANNFAQITGYEDNTVEQFQALIDLGFLDLSASFDESVPDVTDLDDGGPLSVTGTQYHDNLVGSIDDDIIFSGGLVSGTESITSNGGSDRLVFNSNDALVANEADDSDGHIRIRDFVIDSVATNDEADILDISDLIANMDIGNIDDYLHVVSGLYGSARTGVFIDVDGQFTDDSHSALDADPTAGGYGADLFLEFQGQAANNNFAQITGYADNTVEQFKALIDLGFLEIA